MAKVVTLGEIMLRLSPPLYNKIQQATTFEVNYGGGEANVAISLAYFGHKSYFITKLPQDAIGSGAIRHLRGHNVNVDFVSRGGANVGIYFLEMGFAGRPSTVLYNRQHSAFSSIEIEDIEWENIFSDADWFHISGITLALNPQVRKVAAYAINKAKQLKTKVSFDFNYRSKLWTKEEAKKAILEILPNVDVCFSSFFDATEILGYKIPTNIEGKQEKNNYALRLMLKDFNIKYIFGTDREIFSANDNSLATFVVSSEESFYSKPYRFNIFDRIGGGDAFASGVIHMLLNNYDKFQDAAEFGLATSVLKHTISGDASILSEKEVQNFIQTSGIQAIGR
jgi:2-dehydro-3-deoxygluconokinase